MPAEPALFGAVVLSCEHASSHVPARHAGLFRGAGRLLGSHRGHDIGAAWLARFLARELGAPLFVGAVSRLVIDLNRSLHHRAVFSGRTRTLPAAERTGIVARYYAPYRDAVEQAVRQAMKRAERVLHLSVHSFTPRLGGEVRRAEIGLLYDPSRPLERTLCARWQDALVEADAALRVRRNYPYRGTSDGFSVALRRVFPATRYACIELEVNQRLLGQPGARRTRLAGTVVSSLASSLATATRAATVRRG